MKESRRKRLFDWEKSIGDVQEDVKKHKTATEIKNDREIKKDWSYHNYWKEYKNRWETLGLNGFLLWNVTVTVVDKRMSEHDISHPFNQITRDFFRPFSFVLICRDFMRSINEILRF